MTLLFCFTIWFSGYNQVNYGLAGFLIAVSLIHTVVLTIVAIAVNFSDNKCGNKVCSIFFPIKENLHYIFSAVAYLLPLIFSVMRIVNVSTGCCDAWQYHFGLFAIVFGWAKLIHLFSKFPFIGVHSIVFFTIVWTFLKLALFALLLVLASVFVLMTVFYDEQALVSVHVLSSMSVKPEPRACFCAI